MWYECLPSMMIVGVCLYLPTAIGYVSENVVFGNKRFRQLDTPWSRQMFARDARIANGLSWHTKGLDNIPDAK